MSREMKVEAARAALQLVEDGMQIGIGTGSTAEEFVRLLALRVADGLDIIGVPTSVRTAQLCEELGVRLSSLEETPELDLTIDGTDEIDAELNLIKGGGGALLREKIVATASARMIVIADQSKVVETLGRFPLPIEVNPFGLRATANAIERECAALNLAGNLVLREKNGEAVITDGGHFIIDASFGRIHDAEALSAALLSIAGVVQHGLFLQIASKAFIAGTQGVTVMGD